MKEHLIQIIVSAITILLNPTIKYVAKKLIKKYGSITQKAESRTMLTVRIVNMLINLTCFIVLALIWGVDTKNMLVALSSVFAVIGVALFAQWSILSNITAGIIIFFSTPFRIGDRILIMDKDLPIDATIEAILTFYTYLRTPEGKQIIIPNSLFLQKIVSMD